MATHGTQAPEALMYGTTANDNNAKIKSALGGSRRCPSLQHVQQLSLQQPCAQYLDLQRRGVMPLAGTGPMFILGSGVCCILSATIGSALISLGHTVSRSLMHDLCLTGSAVSSNSARAASQKSLSVRLLSVSVASSALPLDSACMLLLPFW